MLSQTLYGVSIPVADHLGETLTEVIRTGDWVQVDGDAGIVRVFQKDGE